MSGAIVTQACAVQLEPCRCGTERLPTLNRRSGRSYLVQYVCRSCGHKGANAISAERAAKTWNADMSAKGSA